MPHVVTPRLLKAELFPETSLSQNNLTKKELIENGIESSIYLLHCWGEA
jgi:hypothetical protein